MDAAAYPHETGDIELIETHISWVLLTGSFAYKIKKPVDFGFLDFSTLDKRRYFCEQELVLNRRLAAAVYLDVVAIVEQQGQVRIVHVSDQGNKDTKNVNVIEYAVKMRQFPQSAQLDVMLAENRLTAGMLVAFADRVAAFHQAIAVAACDSHYGSNTAVWHPVDENFRQVAEHINSERYDDVLSRLLDWSRHTYEEKQAVFSQRKSAGFIRQCHGDMHLRNMLWLDDMPMAFDCLEFNPDLSWIDVISEIAFLVMDLQDRGQQRLANRFLNRYLEQTGDYAGLATLPYYLCYRAMVRAKVDILRLGQDGLSSDESTQITGEFESYLALAERYTASITPMLFIMRGLSASGKSTVSQQIVDHFGVIRLRSDVERKRLFDRPLSTDAAANTAPEAEDEATVINTGIYSEDASARTYARLLELASQTIAAGYSVIIDAAFLKHEQRHAFQQLTRVLDIEYVILDITAPHDVLRQRIIDRKNDVSDATITVLEHQIQNARPLLAEEQAFTVTIDTTVQFDPDSLREIIDAPKTGNPSP